VDFTNVNLTGANLTNANTAGANLTGANLTNANLTGVKLIVPGNAIVVPAQGSGPGGIIFLTGPPGTVPDLRATGFAVFTDITGRTLTYTAPANSDGGGGGGSVSINPTTGAFVYTPSDNQIRNNRYKAPDSFTVTASNGLVTATQSITILGVFYPPTW
jgi:VCBS repeat-containing protein